jgi:hypothetical protein
MPDMIDDAAEHKEEDKSEKGEDGGHTTPSPTLL